MAAASSRGVAAVAERLLDRVALDPCSLEAGADALLAPAVDGTAVLHEHPRVARVVEVALLDEDRHGFLEDLGVGLGSLEPLSQFGHAVLAAAEMAVGADERAVQGMLGGLSALVGRETGLPACCSQRLDLVGAACGRPTASGGSLVGDRDRRGLGLEVDRVLVGHASPSIGTTSDLVTPSAV